MSTPLPARFDVLVVDDDERVRELVMSYLSSQGVAVTGAHDGAAAISLLQRSNGRFRMVITDLNLPGADGFAVLHAARQANASCYVVIVTGYASLDSAILAVRVGAYDYLTKPFSLGQLDVILGRIADRASLELENRELVHTAAGPVHAAAAAAMSGAPAVAKPPDAVAAVSRPTAALQGPSLMGNTALGSIEYRLSVLEQAVARIEARLGSGTPTDRL
jgi:DNA-binding NtrC family response regulator